MPTVSKDRFWVRLGHPTQQTVSRQPRLPELPEEACRRLGLQGCRGSGFGFEGFRRGFGGSGLLRVARVQAAGFEGVVQTFVTLPTPAAFIRMKSRCKGKNIFEKPLQTHG